MSVQSDIYGEILLEDGSRHAVCIHGGHLAQFPNATLMNWLMGWGADDLGPPPQYFEGLPDDLGDEVAYAVEYEESLGWLWLDDLKESVKNHTDMPGFFVDWLEKELFQPIEAIQRRPKGRIRLIVGSG